jgi:hypothetical protein
MEEQKMKKSLILALVAALMAMAFPVMAQEPAETEEVTPPQIGYFLTADENGIQQVWQQVFDGSKARQITTAEGDVLSFGAALDGLSVAYISDGQLWLQPIHTETPEALAEITAEQFFSAPVFSEDNQYIAYADNGVWLLDLDTRETRQLLVDVPVAADGSNMAEYRIYRPEMFVLDEAGKADKLIVDVGVWEWNSAGVYDLETGDLQELEGQIHTRLLPLSNGKVLVYGNSGFAGEFGLHMADSVEDINDYQEALNFRSLTENTLYAEQAVEIEPGIVRVFGQALGEDPMAATVFYFDYNVETGEATPVNFVTVAEADENNYTLPGKLSPDGDLLPVFLDTIFSDQGGFQARLALFDLTAGEPLDLPLPELVGQFEWQQ